MKGLFGSKSTRTCLPHVTQLVGGGGGGVMDHAGEKRGRGGGGKDYII